MNREIKFRFWDTNKRIWCGWEISGWINIVKRDDPRQTVTIHPKYDHIICMQYTGLKDKNGVDIFEGDICGGGTYGRFVVEWNDDATGFGPFTIPGSGGYEWENEEAKKVKVVGNIWENPELLEKK